MKVSKINFKNLLILCAIIAITGFLSSQTLAQGGFSGSIQTTNSSGTAVNQNLFDSKADVYLNGGPQNMNASGLPNGPYYFQVTEPNGTLLSSDNAVCRQLQVINGRVAGAAGSCPHANGTFNPNNGTTPVQLSPFNDTTNAGGVYKVWLIRQNSNTTIDPMNPKVLRFRNADSKTDNFKIKTNTPPQNVTYTLSGCKFYDADASGDRNSGESGIPNVQIVVVINGVADNPIFTDTNGCWSRAGVPEDAEYLVQEILPLTGMEPAFYWVQTAPSEISIPDPNGMPGDYLVVRAHNGIASGGTATNGVVTINGLNFGNICFGPNDTGRTKGYWTNKNGESEMTNGMVNQNVTPPGGVFNPGMPGDLAFLRALNLYGESTVKKQTVTIPFDPQMYKEFKDWLSSSNAYNMSYMLSAQLAATSLNVRHKRFSDSQIVDARNVCDSTGYCLGLITIGNVRMLANQSLDANNGGNTTISGSPHRESQELMKNFLDAVNNNWLSFAQGSACPVTPFIDPPQP